MLEALRLEYVVRAPSALARAQLQGVLYHCLTSGKGRYVTCVTLPFRQAFRPTGMLAAKEGCVRYLCNMQEGQRCYNTLPISTLACRSVVAFVWSSTSLSLGPRPLHLGWSQGRQAAITRCDMLSRRDLAGSRSP